MRAFLAIELPDPVRAALALLQADLKHSDADVKWVDASHVHLTMRFLGDINAEQVTRVTELAARAAQQTALITMELSGLGAFPSAANPQVIWAGIEQGKAELTALAGALEAGCQAIGLAGEHRPFAAHVTLGRMRSGRGRAQLVTQLQKTRWTPPAPFVSDHLTLVESRLSSAGPAYRIVQQFPFQP